jgi:stearoyl-CoA desaturase (delta-9 desaturase)
MSSGGALLVYCLGYVLLAGLAINVTYHRCLSHRSLQLAPWLARVFVTVGLPAGTPIQWVGNHRFHHSHTDVEGDPHSPLRDGFWFAHVGWYLGTHQRLACVVYALAGPLRILFDGWHRPRTNQQFNGLAADVAKDAYYRFVSRPAPYLLLCWLHAALLVGLAYLGWGVAGVVAAWAVSVFVFNAGDAIDSVSHLWGQRPYQTGHYARNGWVMAVLTLGEGWHANHHTFPQSARHGLLPGQFDFTWHVIQALRMLGLAQDVRVPSRVEVAARLSAVAA